ADAIHGDEGADRISGGAGADWLFGGAGVDELNGDEGADFLFGGDNFDILRGGAHGDWLEAGSIWEDVDGEGGRDWNAHVWAIDGATESDVDQESSGSCGFLSALAASSRWHDLSQNISYEGNFTYAVWLFDESIGQWTQERVRFDGSSRTMTDVNFDPKSVVEGEFWTIVYQRAYLQRYYGFDDSNWILTAWMTGETPARPMQAITGNAPWETATADWPADYFRQWLAAGPMTACDGEHCYAIADIFLDETGAWKVVLLNPWGVDGTHEGGLTWESEPATFTAGNDGYLTMACDVFAANLPYAFVTV
ncbi:MAG TPA: hypothetical protein VEQ85_12490, partial [Lacipirellulaceae bacterium]|nr:hypothetical protein [Lacipirellulaceae bacterium]